MIELIKIAQKFAGDIINEITSGKIHVVCMAQNGLTHLNVYAELYCKIPKQVVNQSVDLVNSKKETGTLFPQAYISILPKSDNKTRLTEDELVLCINDVFKANQEYLKSEIIYFSLESGYIDKSMAFTAIQDYVNKNTDNDLFVKTVWYEN